MLKTEDAVAAYWNERIHDLEMTDQPVGSPGFFRDLAEYRFDKLRYLQNVVDFGGYAGKRVLEVGCGLGLDLMLFARGGAHCTGIDLSAQAIGLAGTYFEGEGIEAEFSVMDGAAMEYDDDTFDVVYVHGVLPYAADAAAIVRDCHRVLSRFAKVGLELDDAPVFRPRTRAELAALLEPFDDVRIVGERFPVKSRLHKGLKGALFNGVFVPAFRILPKAIVRRWGWHWMAYGRKASGS